MDYAHPYENWETVYGVPLAEDRFLRSVRSWPWAVSFYRLAEVAALLANHDSDDEPVKRKTVDPLLHFPCAPPAAAHLLEVLRTRRATMVVAHEEVISWLQHLVLLQGADAEPLQEGALGVPDPDLCAWLLAGNTLIGEQHGPVEPASDELSATLVKLMRFNNRPDPARLLVRAKLLFDTPPPRPPAELADDGAWMKLQTAAFGTSFDEFFVTALGPVYMLSSGWGPGESPLVDLGKWRAQTKVPLDRFAKAIEGMSATREELRAQIRVDAKGFPVTPTALLYKPFVRAGDGLFVGSSPWQLRNQMSSGIWNRYRRGAQQLFGEKRGGEIWLSVFGDMVEAWCRRVAAAAAKTSTKGTFVVSEKIGDETEFEDIVVVEDGCAVLFSVKASMMPEAAARTGTSAADTLNWLERFLLAKPSKSHRGGALRLLQNRLGRIRGGELENCGVTRDAEVFPVVVTYDSLGEHDLLYKHLERRCGAEGLLRGPNVAPPVLGDLEDFELLMTRLAHGESIVDVLKRRQGSGANRRLDQLLGESTPTGQPKRLAFFNESYRQIMDNIHMRLFGHVPDAVRVGLA
jgi:hypothetical protein